MYDNPCCFLIYKYNINRNHALHVVIVSHNFFYILHLLSLYGSRKYETTLFLKINKYLK